MTSEYGVPVALVPFTREHVSRTWEWVQDPEFRRTFLMRGDPDRAKHDAYWNTVMSDPTQRAFAILAAGRHVGNCAVRNLRPPAGDAEIWIYVGESAMRGKGVGYSATERLLAVCFRKLGLDKVCLHVADSNQAARAIYLRLGFRDAPLGPNDEEWQGRGCRVHRMELGRSPETSPSGGPRR